MENVPHKITLQKATSADIKTLIELERKTESRTYSATTTEEGILEEMKKGPAYLIKYGNSIVGSVAYEVNPDSTIYLSGLIIDSQYQGRGFGKEALEQVLEEVKGALKVELHTHPDNVKAIALYQSLGFEIVGREENPFGDGEPRIVLARHAKPDSK